MSTFPSILTSYTNPNPTDRLNAPSHSGIETDQNSGLSQVEAVIGVEGSASVVGTLQYFAHSPASDGGGHVQAVNKGGTGQITYTKGDLLVASSSSVLAKQAIGTDTYVFMADSTKPTGVTWTPITPMIGFSTTPQTLLNSTAVTSVYSSVLAAGFFTANTGMRIAANYSIQWTTASGPIVDVNILYNSSLVGAVSLSTVAPGGDGTIRTYTGTWQSVVMNQNDTTVQRSVTNVMGIIQENTDFSVANVRHSDVRSSVTGAVTSTAGQVTLAVTYKSGVAATDVGWTHNSLTVEKLVKIAP